ncbi:MAG: AAA family ATPase [Solirubrobacterales bacterium]|nr:AAA family ATPase [Solirubrobacterales bacterium]
MSSVGRVLLERERELGEMTAQLDQACDGFGSLLVVEGPAGIGKTTLIRATIAEARKRGMTVISGRGGVLEQDVEYGVVRQMVERVLVEADPDERARLLAGPAAPAGAALGFSDLPADPGPGRDGSENLLHGFYWLTVNLAERGPILAIFDDAHWGDGASLATSAYLAHRVEGHPIAMLAGVRDDEPLSKSQVMGPVFEQAGARFVRPRPLSAQAVGQVLSDAFGVETVSPELAEAALRATAGNPFFATELARELAGSHEDPTALSPDQVLDADPTAVRRTLLMRLGALGDPPRRLAQALATLGGEGELRHAMAIAGLDTDEAERAADTLIASGLVDGVRPIKLSHPLVQAAISDDIPASARAVLHRRTLEILAAEGASDEALLVHALNGEPNGEAETVSLLRRTAERARLSGAPETAAGHLRRALAEPPTAAERPKVVAELGRAEVRGGDFATGMRHLDEALQGLTGAERRIDVHRDRAFAAFASGGMDGARDLVTAALAELGDSDGALQLEADLATLAWLTGSDSGVDLKRHLGVEGRTPAERTILGLLSQEEHATGAHPDQVIELATRALGNGRMIAEDTSESLAWYMATYSLLTCEAFSEARTTIEQALADGRRRGSAFARAGALGCRSVLAMNEGRPGDAEVDARAAAAGGIPPIMVPVNASFRVRALTEQGRLEEAQEELVAGGIEHGPGGPTVLRWVPWGRAVLHEAQGDLEAVRVDVAPLEEDDRSGRSMKALSWRALLARSIARGGYSDEADRLATEHLEWAEWWGRPGAMGIAHRAFALAGPVESRVERMDAAVETLAGSSLATEEAKARVELGIALLRSGRKKDGQAELEAGLEVAGTAGARLTAAVAARELEVSGAAPRRLAFDELTASERRVAEYAAGGRTNREIAEELFVTPKTVENHLTRVYAKLGIASRRDLAAAL